MNIQILKQLRRDFGKKYKITLPSMNNLRWHSVTTDPRYDYLLEDFNILRKKIRRYIIKLII